jgi:hypothetical protein
MAAAGWYLTEASLPSVNADINGFWGSYDPSNREAANENYVAYSAGKVSLIPTDAVSDGFYSGLVHDINKNKYSMGLKCHSYGAAGCTKQCVLQVHTSADDTTSGGGGSSVRMTPENLAAWNTWEFMDGTNMGKFSTHNLLEPRHRSYYLTVHTSAEKAADKTSHAVELDFGSMFESRLVSVHHLMYDPQDPATDKILYTQVRGLSSTFPAKALCLLLDVYNIKDYKVLGQTLALDDFDPKLWGSAGGTGSFSRTTGIAPHPSPVVSSGWNKDTQLSAVAQTRRWGLIRCDPMEGAKTTDTPLGKQSSLPLEGQSGQSARIYPTPSLYAPPCLYAIDSTNAFVAALQFEFSKTTKSVTSSSDMMASCEQAWWFICGGGQPDTPSATRSSSIPYWARLPEQIKRDLNSGYRYCLCAGCTESQDGSSCSSPPFNADLGIEQAVMHGTDIAGSDGCPGKLVSAACATFNCWPGVNAVGDSDSNIGLHCGWRLKSAEQMAGGLDTAAWSCGTGGSTGMCAYAAPCSPIIPYTAASAEVSPDIALVEVEGVYEVGSLVGGSLRGTGIQCDIGMMTTAHGDVKSLKPYDYTALIGAVGSLGVHIAVMMVPPFGLHVTAIPVFTDPGMNCLFQFENWIRRIKTSYLGYFYIAPAARIAQETGVYGVPSSAFTDNEWGYWSHNPFSVTGLGHEYSMVGFREYRSQSSSSSAWCSPVELLSYYSGIACGLTAASASGAWTITDLMANGVNRVAMTTAIQGGSWLVKRVDHTCICAYKYGVNCPLFDEIVAATGVRTFKKTTYTSMATCCALLEEASLAKRTGKDFELLHEIMGQPISEHVYDLMRLGFTDCAWFDAVYDQSAFGYQCPMDAAAAGHDQRHYPYIPIAEGSTVVYAAYLSGYNEYHSWAEDDTKAYSFYWETLKSDYTTPDPHPASNLKYQNLHFYYASTEMLWHMHVNCKPGHLAAGTVLLAGVSVSDIFDARVALPTYSASCTSPQLHSTPLFSSYVDKCSNWEAGCHYVQYVNLITERGQLTEVAALTAPDGISVLPNGEVVYGEAHFCLWSAMTGTLGDDDNVRVNKVACFLPWAGFWAMDYAPTSTYVADSETAAGKKLIAQNSFWTKIFKVRHEVYFMTFAAIWKATKTDISNTGKACAAGTPTAKVYAKDDPWSAGTASPFVSDNTGDAPVYWNMIHNITHSHQDAGNILGYYLAWCQWVSKVVKLDKTKIFVTESAAEYSIECHTDAPLDFGYCNQNAAITGANPAAMAPPARAVTESDVRDWVEAAYKTMTASPTWTATTPSTPYTWAKSTKWYMAGLAMWVPFCDHRKYLSSGAVNDKGTFCFRRASHCAFNTWYNKSIAGHSATQHYCATLTAVSDQGGVTVIGPQTYNRQLVLTASAGKGHVGYVTTANRASWLFGVDRTFSKMAFWSGNAALACSQGAGASPWGASCSDGQLPYYTHVWPGGGLYMKDNADATHDMHAVATEGFYSKSYYTSSCTSDLGHTGGLAARFVSCFGVMPTPVDISFGCLADFCVHGAMAGEPIVLELGMLCGYHYSCIFMVDFSCASSNRDFLSYEGASAMWASGAAQKVPATTVGVYVFDGVDYVGRSESATRAAEEAATKYDVPAKGLKGFSSYGSRTCFDFETFRYDYADTEGSIMSDYGVSGSLDSYSETLAFAIRMQLYAGCLFAALPKEADGTPDQLRSDLDDSDGVGTFAACQTYSPPRWYVCASLPVMSSAIRCMADRAVSGWITDEQTGTNSLLNMAPWFSFLRPGYVEHRGESTVVGFPRTGGACVGNEYIATPREGLLRLSCKVADSTKANSIATANTAVYDPIGADKKAARKLGWALDSADGVIDDAFSIDFAFAGPVQHDGGYGGGSTGFMPEYTRVQGGKMFHPVDGSYTPADLHGGTYLSTGGTTISRFGYSAWAVPTANKPVTAIVFDSGIAYMHSEYRMGQSWPWVAIDTHSGVGTFCWGTQAINPLWTLQDAETPDTHMWNADPYTTVNSGSLSTFTSRGLSIYESNAIPNGCLITSSKYSTTICKGLDESGWVPATLTQAGSVRSNSYMGEQTKFYKLAPSRFGNVPYGTSAVCDGTQDAYRELGIWDTALAAASGTAQDTAVCLNFATACSATDGSCGEMTATIGTTEYNYRRVPYSYDVRNGQMCFASDISKPWCFQNDPRTCLLASSGQFDKGLGHSVYTWRVITSLLNTSITWPSVSDISGWYPDGAAFATGSGYTDQPMIGADAAFPPTFLCKCSAPSESLYHPPWDFVEFGLLFGGAAAASGFHADEAIALKEGWGYWGASSRSGNSAFFDHCPCGNDVCGHGTTVTAMLNGYHFGFTVDVEVWHMKATDDGCMQNWFSMALTLYTAGYSYRFPALMTASTAVAAFDPLAKDAIGEATMYASYRMGLTMCNSAGNWDVSACVLVPANLSPYVITTGATAIKLTSTAFPDFHPPQSVDEADPEHYPFGATFNAGTLQFVSSWDTMPSEMTHHLIQDEVAWWTNWGSCTELYAPGEAQWSAIVNAMVDVFGRDWGTTIIMRAQGTSFSSPKTAAVIVMIMQAQLEISFTSYTGVYDIVDQCSDFVDSGALRTAFTDINYCGTSPRGYTTVFEKVAYLLPDPQGCTSPSDNSAYYIEETCTLGYWHLDGLSCGQCGTYTIRSLNMPNTTVLADVGIDMASGMTSDDIDVYLKPTVSGGVCAVKGDYYGGFEPCSTGAPDVSFMIHNNVWRPMLQARLGNRNIAEPETTVQSMAYHMLYMLTYIRHTLLDVRAEHDVTTSGTVWYHPGGEVLQVLLSPCGAGDSAADYYPGFLYGGSVTPGVARACCPLCSEVLDDSGAAVVSGASKRCRWPAISSMQTLPTCTTAAPGGSGTCSATTMAHSVEVATSGTSVPVAAGKNPVSMLLASMYYDVVRSSIMMKAQELYLMSAKGTSTVSLYLAANAREVSVTVPSRIGVMLSAHQETYTSTVLAQYGAQAAGELYPTSVAMPASWDLGWGPYGLTLDGTAGKAHAACSASDSPGCQPVPMQASNSDTGLLFNLGCASSSYFSGMPWCLLKAGAYRWSNTQSTTYGQNSFLWEPFAYSPDPIASSDPVTVDLMADTNNFTSLYPDFIKYFEYNTEAGVIQAEAQRQGNSPSTLEKRLNCLFRHYDFFTTMLDCASTNMESLITADPGCGTKDMAARRYQCLCRRRTRYVMVSNVEDPAVAGSTFECAQEDNTSCLHFEGSAALKLDFDAVTVATQRAVKKAMATVKLGYIYYAGTGSGSS